MSSSTSTSANRKKPTDFLKLIIGRPVVIKLNSGIEYRGVLSCLDGYLNVALEQCEEYERGVKKSQLGDCFIRGNNVMYIGAERA
jgi:U6 snRNA-associated Sm-like protein LSm6